MENTKKKIHRFAQAFQTGASSMEISDPDLVHQLRSVLKMHPGEEVRLFHHGREVIGRIGAIDQHSVHLVLHDEREVAAEPKRQLTAYVAMFRKEPFEWMLEKLTEVGVSAVVPIETARTVRFPWKPERFRMILKEAAEQSGRGIVPTLVEPMPFRKALEHARGNEKNVLFDIAETKPSRVTAGRVGFFIGPEGGFTDDEVAAARTAGCDILGLGSLVLRAETAAIIAAHVLLEE